MRAIALPLIVLAVSGCSPTDSSDPDAAGRTGGSHAQESRLTEQDLRNRETAAGMWEKFPELETRLDMVRTGTELETVLTEEQVRDSFDTFFVLDGLTIDGRRAALRLSDIGSGRAIYVVTVYLDQDGEWHLAYRAKEAIVRSRVPGTDLRVEGLSVVWPPDGPHDEPGIVMLLPGEVDYAPGP